MKNNSHFWFIAGSKELSHERTLCRAIFGQMQNKWGDSFYVKTYEDFPTDLTHDLAGRQKDYNQFISQKADGVIFIFDKNVGGITMEEFEEAYKSSKTYHRPKIYVYCKKVNGNDCNDEDAQIKGLIEHLQSLGQYYVEYNDYNELRQFICNDIDNYLISKRNYKNEHKPNLHTSKSVEHPLDNALSYVYSLFVSQEYFLKILLFSGITLSVCYGVQLYQQKIHQLMNLYNLSIDDIIFAIAVILVICFHIFYNMVEIMTNHFRETFWSLRADFIPIEYKFRGEWDWECKLSISDINGQDNTDENREMLINVFNEKTFYGKTEWENNIYDSLNIIIKRPEIHTDLESGNLSVNITFRNDTPSFNINKIRMVSIADIEFIDKPECVYTFKGIEEYQIIRDDHWFASKLEGWVFGNIDYKGNQYILSGTATYKRVYKDDIQTIKEAWRKIFPRKKKDSESPD